MICLGCSSTGSDLINAATSAAVFHFASYHGNSDVIMITWQCIHAHLTQSLLPHPHWCVNNLQEQLASLRIEHKDGSIDRLCSEVTFKCLQIDAQGDKKVIPINTEE